MIDEKPERQYWLAGGASSRSMTLHTVEVAIGWPVKALCGRTVSIRLHRISPAAYANAERCQECVIAEGVL
jgi:hypothetical protein